MRPDPAQALAATARLAIAYELGTAPNPVEVATAYCNANGLQLVDIISGIDWKGLLGSQGVVYGFVAEDPATGLTHVAIRGTDSVKEAGVDLYALPAPHPRFPGVMAHAGALGVYETLVLASGAPLRSALAGKSVVLALHSLGGGLGNLLALDVGKSMAWIESFESMRVFNEAGADLCDTVCADHRRYVVIGDIVPHLPPENIGYIHAGVELELDPSGIPFFDLEELHALSTVTKLIAAQVAALGSAATA